MNTQTIHEHGAVLIDGIQAGTTQKCPHCNGHFLVAAQGSLSDARKVLGNAAHPRVWCQKCGRLTCGRKYCDPAIFGCFPIEARLELREGKPNPAYADVAERLAGADAPLL